MRLASCPASAYAVVPCGAFSVPAERSGVWVRHDSAVVMLAQVFLTGVDG